MIHINVTIPKLNLNTGFSRTEMIKIAAKAIQTIQNRLAKALGINDRKMKKLSPAYAKKKASIGQPAVRNLMFSGAMQGAMGVVEASTNRAVIGFTRRSETAKAEWNQKRSPWYGISRRDEEMIMQFADRVFKNRKQTT